MLIVKNITVSYHSKPVLTDINLSLEEGHIYGIVGLNGAGKTTLFNTIYQFITPLSGTIRYGNEALRRKNISLLETDNYFYPYITGYEYLKLFAGSENNIDYKKCMELFSLPLHDPVESYSTGMKKKLALLAVLKQDKPILLLDEPFNGLDIESVHLLFLLLEKLRSRKKIILISSHILETLMECSDKIYYLEKGSIQKTYSKNDFPLLEETFKVLIREKWAKNYPTQLDIG